MTALTYGDTFTIPATGDYLWRIRDVRPVSPQWPGGASFFGRSTARANCGTDTALYTPGVGWKVFKGEGDQDAIAAQLNALDVHLEPRTDDEWRTLHLDDLRVETEQAMSTVVGFREGPFPPHPMIPEDELIAHVAASAAVAAAKKPVDGLYDAVYTTTLERLRA